MAAQHAPACQDPISGITAKIFISIVIAFAAVAIPLLGYLTIASLSEQPAARNLAFYADCQQELAATYDRITGHDINAVCYGAAIGQPWYGLDHATRIKSALKPAADGHYLENQYLNQTRRHAPDSWNPLNIPMYLN